MRLHGLTPRSAAWRRGTLAGALAVVLTAIAAAPAATSTSPPPSRTLHLVTAQTLQGTFTGSEDVWADSHRIYLASLQGKLFVLARNRATGFPTVQVVRVGHAPLTAVRGDASHVYVLASDGTLRVYRRRAPLVLERTRHLHVGTTALGGSLAVVGGRIYAAAGALAVDSRHVFLEAGVVGAAYDVKHLARRVTYAGRFHADATNVYDRACGRKVATIHHAPGPAMLYVDDRVLVIYGLDDGATIYDPRTLRARGTIAQWVAGRDGLARQGRWLISSDLIGTVAAFDLHALPAVSFSSIYLPEALGLAPDDIHLYGGLWSDTRDGLIFAGGSQFDPFDVGFAPSFFVLELRRP